LQGLELPLQHSKASARIVNVSLIQADEILRHDLSRRLATLFSGSVVISMASYGTIVSFGLALLWLCLHSVFLSRIWHPHGGRPRHCWVESFRLVQLQGRFNKSLGNTLFRQGLCRPLR
jgi:hypothetical protein